MKTIKTISTLMLAAGMILVSEAALAQTNDHQEHSDHQDRNGRGSDNGNGLATRNGKDSGTTYKNEKSKPGPAGAVTWGGSPPRSPPRAGVVTWGGSPPRSPAPARKGLHINGNTTSRPPVNLKSDPMTSGKPVKGEKTPMSSTEPITKGVPISGGSPPRSPVANTSPTAAGPPAGAAVVSNGQVKLYIPISPSGLSVTSDKPGTITVSNGDPSHSVTLPGGSVTISGGGVNAVGAAPGIQVVSHPNGDFAAVATSTTVPVPARTTVTGGPEGGFVSALGNGVVDAGKDVGNSLVGFATGTFKASVPDNKTPNTSTSIQR
jgi:hypothetical protein